MSYIFTDTKSKNIILLSLFVFFFLTTFMDAKVVQQYGDNGYYSMEYHRDHRFEDAIGRSNIKSCMPEYNSIEEISSFAYAKRVLYNVYKECGKDVSTKNIIKYGLLTAAVGVPAVVAAVAPPTAPITLTTASVGAAVTPFALGEFQSDTAKCVLKAFIESSDADASKKAGKDILDKFFLIKDWSSYFGSLGRVVPELMGSRSMQDFESIAEFVASTPERTIENIDRENIVQSTADSLNTLFVGSTRIAIKDTKSALKNCDIPKALEFLEYAIKSAKLECRAYGVDYRGIENSIESAINRNYWHFSNITGHIPADDELSQLSQRLDSAYSGLYRVSKVFTELQELQKKVTKRSDELLLIRKNYKRQLDILQNSGKLADMCKGVSTLDVYLQALSPECRDAIVSQSSLKTERDALLMKINNTARELSLSRWNKLVGMSASLSSCSNLKQIEKRLKKLQRSIAKNPLYIYRDSTCQLVDQRTFDSELHTLKRRFQEKKRECRDSIAQESSVGFWRRSAGEVIKGELIWKRKFCFGDEERIQRLSEGKYSSRHYAHHPSCPGQYNLQATISFDSPPPKIAAGDTVYLESSGSKHGYQTCCFIIDWFQYKGSCFSSKPKEYVSLDLRSKYKKRVPISIPGIKKAKGLQGAVHNKSRVALTMPKKGKTCTVIGHTNNGLHIKWTYIYEKAHDSN